MWFEETFPGLRDVAHEVTSDPAEEYNCIAWAAGDQTAWWSHAEGYRWPGANRTPLIESLVTVFVGLGYEVCEDGTLEQGFEKVALYVRNHMWRHAARQLPNGRWTSKLGPDEDIEHETAEALCGVHYGTVHCFMRRRSDAEAEAKAGR